MAARSLGASKKSAAVRRRVSAKGNAIKASAPAKTQRAVTVKGKTGSQKVTVVRTKSVQEAGRDNMTALNGDALTELVEFLSQPENQSKILAVLRMAKTDSYFCTRRTLPTDWIHHTLIYLKSVSKTLWKEVLLTFAKAKNLRWDEKLLAFCDKKYELHGIEAIVCYLGRMTYDDHLAKELHYKPLLIAVMVERFKTCTGSVTIGRDGTLSFDPPLYKFGAAANGRHSSIIHTPTGTEASIPDDLCVRSDGSWRIVDDWSTFDASLVGKRRSENVFSLFEEDDKEDNISYDTDTFLDYMIAAVLGADPNLRENFQGSQRAYDAAVRDGEAGAEDAPSASAAVLPVSAKPASLPKGARAPDV